MAESVMDQTNRALAAAREDETMMRMARLRALQGSAEWVQAWALLRIADALEQQPLQSEHLLEALDGVADAIRGRKPEPGP